MKDQNIWTAIVEWPDRPIPGGLRYTEEVDVIADTFREAEKKVTAILAKDYQPGATIRSIVHNNHMQIWSW